MICIGSWYLLKKELRVWTVGSCEFGAAIVAAHVMTIVMCIRLPRTHKSTVPSVTVTTKSTLHVSTIFIKSHSE